MTEYYETEAIDEPMDEEYQPVQLVRPEQLTSQHLELQRHARDELISRINDQLTAATGRTAHLAAGQTAIVTVDADLYRASQVLREQVLGELRDAGYTVGHARYGQETYAISTTITG